MKKTTRSSGSPGVEKGKSASLKTKNWKRGKEATKGGKGKNRPCSRTMEKERLKRKRGKS